MTEELEMENSKDLKKHSDKNPTGKPNEVSGIMTEEITGDKKNDEKDPTRFGDWEVNGRAIDF